ncbi:Transcription elongation factor SPT5 [Psilocybe cubensis]|uniref:Chromatin elongation factor SPT5 n=2 Tax=Psilocybe cubensis TaxID=181762 RepID=A0A8H7XV53_PSICU|nr:Transcription elongation factor SPT5 [Psilocybe cubensis]KAH9478870.1 Transcription elongation factor SPT5 [Psilocybe cubensis]
MSLRLLQMTHQEPYRWFRHAPHPLNLSNLTSTPAPFLRSGQQGERLYIAIMPVSVATVRALLDNSFTPSATNILEALDHIWSQRDIEIMEAMRSVRQFLDMEAQVADDGELSDEEQFTSAERDLEDAFINDGAEIGGDDHRGSLAFHSIEDGVEEDEFDRLLARLEAQATGPRRPRLDRRLEEEDSMTKLQETIARLPLDTDYPLWRVGCRIGSEDAAVISLLQSAREIHHIRSAFTRGSIRGSIYVEEIMDSALVNLLLSTPGILRNHLGIKREIVDRSHQHELLTMRDVKKDFDAGSWVLIQKGIYKGDVGLVSATFSWGAQVLLIPRLNLQSAKSRKRKSSVLVPPAKLFEPEEARKLISTPIICNADGSYTLGLLKFDHGLLEKEFDFASIANLVMDIPYSHFSMFRSSNHPDIMRARMPRPREWCLQLEEEVLFRTPGIADRPAKWEPAVLKMLGTYDVEAEQSTIKGGHEISRTVRGTWLDIRKSPKIGQFVRVVSGPYLDYTGWVVGVHEDHALITRSSADGLISIVETRAEIPSAPINGKEQRHVPTEDDDLQKDSTETDVGTDAAMSIDSQMTLGNMVVHSEEIAQTLDQSGVTSELEETLITERSLQAEEGEVSGAVVNIATVSNQNNYGADNDKFETVEHFSVYVNLLDTAFSEPLSPLISELNPIEKRPSKHPWCGLEVIIQKYRHARKGETGRIKDVLHHIDNAELQLVIQLTRFNPFAPFQTIVVDYDDVVEMSSFNELVLFLDPGPNFFRPKPKSSLKHIREVLPDVPQTIASGSDTPMYSQESMTLAWDPSSRTPDPAIHSTSLALSDPSESVSSMTETSHSLNPPTCNHVLLNPKLVGISLNVIVDGGQYNKKAVVATTAWEVNNLVLKCKKYSSWTVVDPTWVTPKYANPIHDNGLLVVIKGEHCGKFVRRIHHESLSDNPTVLVAVVTVSKGCVDVLTGERFTLSTDFLCSVPESKKDRDLNSNVMTQLKERYKKKTL